MLADKIQQQSLALAGDMKQFCAFEDLKQLHAMVLPKIAQFQQVIYEVTS